MKTETKKQKHTPGPWQIVSHNCGLELFGTGNGSNGTDEAFGCLRHEYNTSSADKYLIAAAPELLSALSALAGTIESIRSDYASLHADRDGSAAERQQARAFYASEINKAAEHIDQQLEAATAAIAKAEGR